jgi:hypothetical protein
MPIDGAGDGGHFGARMGAGECVLGVWLFFFFFFFFFFFTIKKKKNKKKKKKKKVSECRTHIVILCFFQRYP